MKPQLTRQQLIEKIEKFIDDNALSVLVATNHYKGGEKTINLGVIVMNEMALDVAEAQLVLNESLNIKQLTPFNDKALESNSILQDADKSYIRREVEQINNYLKTLLG